MRKTIAIQRRHHSGFSLVDLVVVVVVLCALAAIALPGIQSLRESSRRTQCSRQVQQIAVAWLNHESVQGHLPAGGFGWDWVGDPDRGYGTDQPGGWVYNILPYLGHAALHDRGTGTELNELNKDYFRGKLVSSPLPDLYCPSRRVAANYPLGTAWISTNAGTHTYSAKSDYAANAGSSERDADDGFALAGWGPSPEVFRESAAGAMFEPLSAATRNGLQFKQSVVRLDEIVDGGAQTYLVGEKYVNPESYEGLLFRDQDTGENESAYTGFNRDHCRTTFNPPQHDTAGFRADHEFGGPHLGGFNISFCDGSIRFVSFDVDPKVHAESGNRRNVSKELEVDLEQSH
jgi:prepilin-type processing-associated H-X9-DG protein